MKKFILYLWQLPQNIIGLLVILFTGAKISLLNHSGKRIIYYFTPKYNFGVSLGKYIIIGGFYEKKDVLHEYGHQKQSMILGWLYLPIVGISSAIFNNLYDRFFHKSWKTSDRLTWYYSRFPEKWADNLGGVKRNTTSQ